MFQKVNPTVLISGVLGHGARTPFRNITKNNSYAQHHGSYFSSDIFTSLNLYIGAVGFNYYSVVNMSDVIKDINDIVQLSFVDVNQTE